jgi:NAD+ diphosphatase
MGFNAGPRSTKTTLAIYPAGSCSAKDALAPCGRAMPGGIIGALQTSSFLTFMSPSGNDFPVSKVFIPSNVAPVQKEEPALWFAFRGQKMLVSMERSAPEIPLSETLEKLGFSSLSEYYLGTSGDTHCYAVQLPKETELPAHMNFLGLRGLFGHLKDDLYAIAVRALGIINWDRTHRFCGQCGSLAEKHVSALARQCPACGLTLFPRISPAVIVLVERSGKALLARSGRFPEALYSVIAGFVEPGETLEETVKREVKEETGIDVKNVRYFGSQPWPFPDSLMIGFTARYAGGEIKVDNEEILDAAWFSADRLPAIPGKISIARALIDWFVLKQAKTVKGVKKA